jgi:hypothetical protein
VLRKRLDVALLLGVAGAILVLLAAIAGRGFTRPTVPTVALVMLPTSSAQPPLGTPTVTPTPDGWRTTVLTPQPLPTLPGVPAVSLGSGSTSGGAGTAVAYTVLHCPQDLVKITGIVTAKSGWWNVTGTAAIANLGYWKTELSADGSNWTLLYRSSAPVSNGLLMEFNTRTVPKGAYQLRLLAVDATGNYGPPCTVQISTQ